MVDILGLCSISLVSLIILFLGLRWPDVSRILYVALSIRILFILIGHYFVALPDSTKDAQGLEDLAWTYGQDGLLNALSQFQAVNRYFYSQIIGVVYSLFGRSVLMAQSLSLLIGIVSIFLAWSFTKRVWDDSTAIKVGWVLALFPSLILYSILPLGETYQSFFLLIAMIGIFNWVREGTNKYIFLAMFGFFGAALFHGALILGALIFLSIVVFINFKIMIRSIITLHININAFIITIVAIFILQIFFLSKIYIPKIGYFEDINLSFILSELNSRVLGGSSYGDWARIYGDENILELVYTFILRFLYFLFAPFPWDVQKLSHIVGMIDGLLYLILVYLIICNRKRIWNDTFLKIIFVILFAYFCMFALGVSNFGAGLRHRSKFFIEMVLLAGPLIPAIVVSNKNKLIKLKKINHKTFKKD